MPARLRLRCAAFADPVSAFRRRTTQTMSVTNHIANRLIPSPRKRDAGLRAWFAYEGACALT